MSDDPPPTPGDGQERLLRALTDQAYELIRRMSGGVRSLSIRAGDHAVEIEWDPTLADRVAAPLQATAEDLSEDVGVSADHYVLTAPLVGTFYRAPEPGAAAFVEEGTVIEAGETVAIIEAMKIMNSIQAEHGGKVTKILATNGDVVEFGQELMVIEPYEGG